VKRNIRGAVFDLDGTLLRTEIFQYLGWKVPLHDRFGANLTIEEYSRRHCGKSSNEIAPALISRFRLKTTPEELISEKEKLLPIWYRSRKLAWCPYARTALEAFAKSQLRTAVASGSKKSEILLKLERVDALDLFNAIASKEDVGGKGKPHPHIFLYAADKLNIPSHYCVAFEDTRVGVISAKKAGLYVVAIPNEFTLLQDFSQADEVFSSFRQAMPLIKSMIISSS